MEMEDSDDPLSDNISHVESSYLSVLLHSLTVDFNFDSLPATFSWMQCHKAGLLTNVTNPVPDAMDQCFDENCIVVGVYSLLTFQINLISAIERFKPFEVPLLSLSYLDSVFDALEEKTVSSFLSHLAINGIDGKIKSEVGGEYVEKKFKLEYHYGFDCEEEDYHNFLKICVVAYGGVLCELTMTKNYDKTGKKVHDGSGSPVLYGGVEGGHAVALLGWDSDEYIYLNSFGKRFGKQINKRKGYGRTKSEGIHYCYLPQIQKWKS